MKKTYLYIDIIIVFSTILRIVAHPWLEYLLAQLLNSFASQPASHCCLASDDNNQLLKSIVLSIERLPISRVSRRELI